MSQSGAVVPGSNAYSWQEGRGQMGEMQLRTSCKNWPSLEISMSGSHTDQGGYFEKYEKLTPISDCHVTPSFPSFHRNHKCCKFLEDIIYSISYMTMPFTGVMGSIYITHQVA